MFNAYLCVCVFVQNNHKVITDYSHTTWASENVIKHIFVYSLSHTHIYIYSLSLSLSVSLSFFLSFFLKGHLSAAANSPTSHGLTRMAPAPRPCAAPVNSDRINAPGLALSWQIRYSNDTWTAHDQSFIINIYCYYYDYFKSKEI